jgi:hypothetical protein
MPPDAKPFRSPVACAIGSRPTFVELSVDGLSYLVAYMSDLGQTLIVESRKVRAVPCGVVIQSVQHASESALRNEPTPQKKFE